MRENTYRFYRSRELISVATDHAVPVSSMPFFQRVHLRRMKLDEPIPLALLKCSHGPEVCKHHRSVEVVRMVTW